MTAEVMEQPTTSMGPISYLVIEFPRNTMTGEGFAELMNLVDRGLVRVLDLAFVTKDGDGSVRALELQDLDHDGTFDFAVFEGASAGLMDDADLRDAASAMQPGSSAGVLILENHWAARFTDALRRSGAQLVAAGYVSPEAVAESLDATEQN